MPSGSSRPSCSRTAAFISGGAKGMLASTQSPRIRIWVRKKTSVRKRNSASSPESVRLSRYRAISGSLLIRSPAPIIHDHAKGRAAARPPDRQPPGEPLEQVDGQREDDVHDQPEDEQAAREPR